MKVLVRRWAIVLTGLLAISVGSGSPTFAGKVARYDADTPTAALMATCDLVRGQWSVSWRLWPHGDATFVADAGVWPVMSQGGYRGPIGPESDGPKTLSAVLLAVGSVSVQLSVRYWPGDDPLAARGYLQTETLGECVKGTVFPELWGSKYCGGETSVELRNDSGASLDALFRVTATPDFDAQYRVPPGQKVVLYFRQPDADPINIYERGNLFRTVGGWYENPGCATGKGPYCPCSIPGSATAAPGPVPPPGPAPGGTGPTGGGSGPGGPGAAGFEPSAGTTDPSTDASPRALTTPDSTGPLTGEPRSTRPSSSAAADGSWLPLWPAVALLAAGLATAAGICGYVLLRRRRGPRPS